MPLALASVSRQGRADIEVIVVDDGSPDDVEGGMRGCGPSVRCIHQTNKGLPAARNTGLDAAGGEWVVFLDADDWIFPGAVAAWFAAAESHPDGDVICGSWDIVDTAGTVLGTGLPPDLADDPFHGLLPVNPAPCHSYMLRKTVFRTVGVFDEGLRSHEDWDMWLRIAASGARFLPAPDARVAYVRATGSMSANALRMYDTGVAVLARCRSLHPNCARCEQLIAAGTKHYRNVALSGMFADVRTNSTLRGKAKTITNGLAVALRDPMIVWQGFERVCSRATRFSHPRS